MWVCVPAVVCGGLSSWLCGWKIFHYQMGGRPRWFLSMPVCVCVCVCASALIPSFHSSFCMCWLIRHTLIVRCGRQSSVSMLKQLLPRPSHFPSCVRFFAPVWDTIKSLWKTWPLASDWCLGGRDDDIMRRTEALKSPLLSSPLLSQAIQLLIDPIYYWSAQSPFSISLYYYLVH